LKEGMRSLESRPDLTQTTERLSAQRAAQILSSKEAPVVLDVRAPRERAQKFIEGSVSMPLNHLMEHSAELPKNRFFLIHCAGGYRSSIAASLLQKQGFKKISEIAGGITAWETAKLPVQSR